LPFTIGFSPKSDVQKTQPLLLLCRPLRTALPQRVPPAAERLARTRTMRSVAVVALTLATIGAFSSVSAEDDCEDGELQLYLPVCTKGAGDVLFLLDTSNRASNAFEAQLARLLLSFPAPPIFCVAWVCALSCSMVRQQSAPFTCALSEVVCERTVPDPFHLHHPPCRML
jgi:hypothetical protein